MTSKDLSGIALIGMAGRFPGAPDLETFWENLKNGVESTTFFSDEQLLSGGVSREMLENPHYVKAKPLLEGVELFDASFFGFNPQEASTLDPQHRLFLECAWEALEQAGYAGSATNRSVGVFAGSNFNQYLLFHLLPRCDFTDILGSLQTLVFNDKDYLSTLLSYKFNLKGPSLNVQTACSTSLVAVHLACQSLLNYECDLSLAGAVNIRLPQESGYLYQEGGLASPEGRCKSFDAKANGMVFGNGLGVVVLKRLEEALEDGDTIHAVIRGSAVNNDGASKVGFTATSAEGQARVITEALAMANVSPEEIGYFESHGTGTPWGDSIEMSAMTDAFRAATEEKGFCALGSVKTNIGHLETASGMASLLKTVLALKHRALPPLLHFEKPHPDTDLENSPFFVNTHLLPWEPRLGKRIAGVSAFGIGGTNAHVVLEEAPPPSSERRTEGPSLWILSAKTPSALETMTDRLLEHWNRHPDLNPGDVAYTLQLGRSAFAHRRAFVFSDAEEAKQALSTRDPKRVFGGTSAPSPRPVVFLFSHLGKIAPRTTKGLYDTEEVFRDAINECRIAARELLGIDRMALFDAERERTGDEAASAELRVCELFSVEIALARLWQSKGITPALYSGIGWAKHAAACAEGKVELKTALSEALREAGAPSPNVDELIREVCAQPERLLLEIGAPQTLSPLFLKHPEFKKLQKRTLFSSLPAAGEPNAEAGFPLSTLGKLWTLGAPVDWERFHSKGKGRRLPLPSYPFERERYWIPAAPAHGSAEKSPKRVPLDEPLLDAKAEFKPKLPLRHARPPVKNAYRAPETAMERAVAEIWQELMGIDKIGVDDNFFELGGNSLTAVRILGKLKEISTCPLSVKQLVEHPTIAGIATCLETAALPSFTPELQTAKGISL